MRGTVAWFSNQKSYGFIERPQGEGPDVFVYFRDILMEGFKTLTQGDKVEFEVEQRDGRTVATNVRVVEKGIPHGSKSQTKVGAQSR
jgi:CspA family cold shock protein